MVGVEKIPRHLQKTVTGIVCYLIENPNAKDTESGVQRWWLDEKHSQGYAQEALDWLVQRNWVTVRDTGVSKRLYGLNKTQLEAMQNFLRTTEKLIENHNDEDR